jgi:hypothetical protein
LFEKLITFTGSVGARSATAFFMPGSPLFPRARAFLRTGEQYGRHRKKKGFFLVPRVLCEAVLSGVWAFNKRIERERRREREDSNVKNNTGDGTETGSLQPEKETEAGR